MKILFFDTELGGLDPQAHGMTQISAANLSIGHGFKDCTIVGTFDSFIKPRPELRYDDEALNVQVGFLGDDWLNLWDEGEFPEDEPTAADALYAWLMFNGRDETQVLTAFKKWSVHHFGDRSYTVSPWAHNQACDMPFIQAAYDRCFPDRIDPRYNSNDMMPFNRAGRCSMILFRIMRDLGVHGEYKANLDTVMEFYGIEIPEETRHSARGDVGASAQAVFCMLKHLKSHFSA